MPRTRSRLPDSVFRQPLSEARTVWCEDCPKTWRFGCPECALHFAVYHREAFDGHRVTVEAHKRSDDRDWQRDVPASTSRLMGRY